MVLPNRKDCIVRTDPIRSTQLIESVDLGGVSDTSKYLPSLLSFSDRNQNKKGIEGKKNNSIKFIF